MNITHTRIKPAVKFAIGFIGIFALTTIIFIALSYQNLNQRELFDNKYAYDKSNSLSWSNDPNRLSYPLSVNNITLIVDFNNGTIETHSNLSFSDRYTSVFDSVAFYYSITYKSKTLVDKTAYYITAINGIQENLQSGYYWQYYINNNYAQVGANLYSMKNGDQITWNYTNALISS